MYYLFHVLKYHLYAETHNNIRSMSYVTQLGIEMDAIFVSFASGIYKQFLFFIFFSSQKENNDKKWQFIYRTI